eukprot:14985172-Alexandrium_andersonii.AAC.1
METKLLGLLAGPPWHLRGPGPGSAGAGVAAAAPPPGSLSSSPPSSGDRGFGQHSGYEAPLG